MGKNRLEVEKRLLAGEWVDCQEVQEALDIDFATGLRLFEFSRTAKWNPAPLNGQCIKTEFRLQQPPEGYKPLAAAEECAKLLRELIAELGGDTDV